VTSCVFTQTTTDEKDRPIRDEVSTSYTGAIETAELFGRRFYTEAWERGWSRASKKVVLGDGAEWIWRKEVRMGLSTTRPIRVEIVMHHGPPLHAGQRSPGSRLERHIGRIIVQ
jgi:hypothetical protein